MALRADVVNEPQRLRRGNKPSLIVSTVDRTVGISTEVDQYVQLNERELSWLVEEAGPKALAAFAARRGGT